MSCYIKIYIICSLAVFILNNLTNLDKDEKLKFAILPINTGIKNNCVLNFFYLEFSKDLKFIKHYF